MHLAFVVSALFLGLLDRMMNAGKAPKAEPKSP
jgi:hypothetical protein